MSLHYTRSSRDLSLVVIGGERMLRALYMARARSDVSIRGTHVRIARAANHRLIAEMRKIAQAQS